jgi:hypothetical protein
MKRFAGASCPSKAPRWWFRTQLLASGVRPRCCWLPRDALPAPATAPAVAGQMADIRLICTKLLSPVCDRCTDSHDDPSELTELRTEGVEVGDPEPRAPSSVPRARKSPGEPEQGCGTSAGTALVAGHHHANNRAW